MIPQDLFNAKESMVESKGRGNSNHWGRSKKEGEKMGVYYIVRNPEDVGDIEERYLMCSSLISDMTSAWYGEQDVCLT